MTDDYRGWWERIGRDLEAGAAPGGAVWVWQAGAVRCQAAHGFAQLEPTREPLTPDMLFDLASLTKAVATTSCVLALVDDGRLELDYPAATWLPELAAHGKAEVTVRQLLCHLSGLPAWAPLYRTCATRAELRAAVLAARLQQPPGWRCEYSDLGFLTLGFLIEAVTGEGQDAYFRRRLAEPLGLADELLYRPDDPARCVATERSDELRGGVVRGQVHDENAWRSDGVAGHAGLFGTAAAVGRFGLALLESRLFSPRVTAELFAHRDDVAAERFWLGWKRLQYGPDDPAAYGHDGFTGTLLWLSPARELVVALLTNRVHPTRANRRLYDLRPRWLAALVGE